MAPMRFSHISTPGRQLSAYKEVKTVWGLVTLLSCANVGITRYLMQEQG